VRVEATRVVRATPEAVFRFLSSLENHWSLAGRWVEVVAVEDSTGRVRIHGPLGLRRTANTKVVDSEPDHVMHGIAELSGGTRARISWELSEDSGGTAVRLVAETERTAPGDRLLLTLGGRVWLEHRFESILTRLDEQFAGSAPPRRATGSGTLEE
jgi:Polyketide cyclase / dehydrase and lipid transport